MEGQKKRLLSGVKPTGRPHLGNYFGAMKQFVDLLNTGDYECFVFVADYKLVGIFFDVRYICCYQQVIVVEINSYRHKSFFYFANNST